MANIQEIMSYLGDYCRISSSLPTYADFKEGLQVCEVRAETEGLEAHFIVPMKPSDKNRVRKLDQVKKIASHLWGGNEEIKRVFGSIGDFQIHEFIHATTSPLRVKVRFSGDVEKTFYVKDFDEKRLCGLELENILSPHKYEYSASGGGIYEDAILGLEPHRLDDDTKKDPLYLQELVGLDYRVYAFLLADLNPEVNHHNFLVAKEFSGKDYRYVVRPIDFDRLFEIEDLSKDLVLSGRRDEVIKFLGSGRYSALVSLEKEGMRKRYAQNKDRLDRLLSIIGSSDACNKNLSILKNILSVNYNDPRAKDFSKTANIGELLGMHLAMQLEYK